MVFKLLLLGLSCCHFPSAIFASLSLFARYLHLLSSLKEVVLPYFGICNAEDISSPFRKLIDCSFPVNLLKAFSEGTPL